jgi:hypothetical protein
MQIQPMSSARLPATELQADLLAIVSVMSVVFPEKIIH